MIPLSRTLLAASVTLALAAPSFAQQQRKPPVLRGDLPPQPSIAALPSSPPPPATRTAAITPDPAVSVREAERRGLIGSIAFGDVGYSAGFRLSNLGGRREIFLPIPQGVDLSFAKLVLSLDDVSAHEARRSIEILVNDRSVAAIALDGKSTGRTVRVPLPNLHPQDGFLKLAFVYSGAATQDRCIDVRYVGDSVTVLPETAVEFEMAANGPQSVAATAALMPQKVAIVLSSPQLSADDIAAALTLARSLAATGRRVTFHQGFGELPEALNTGEDRKWTRGLVIIGPMERAARWIDAPAAAVATVAWTPPAYAADSNLAAVRMGGVPVLLVTNVAAARLGRLFGNPSLAVLRDAPSASVGYAGAQRGPVDRVSFEELGILPAQAEVFGRAELAATIATRSLPSGTRPSRLVLDVMVAPDGAGEKAVVSALVNERLLASAVAAIGEPTRLDFALPEGLVGTSANLRVLVQRRSAQGDCRFEPQGYPAQLLGSSSVSLSRADPKPQDFADLVTLWGNGVEILIPASGMRQPLAVVGLLSDLLAALSSESASITVRFFDGGLSPVPRSPFIALGDLPPAGSTPTVRFDRGRVAIADRAGRTRLDVGGLTSGAVAQIVTSGSQPGLWIKPLSGDGSVPVPAALQLDRGDIAFVDRTGVALALSSDRETLLRVAYPDQESWWTVVGRYYSWIVGAIWAAFTLIILYVAQRTYRRRAAAPVE